MYTYYVIFRGGGRGTEGPQKVLRNIWMFPYQVPHVPYNKRYCNYCTMQVPGDEVHFLGNCETFSNKRQCLLGKLRSLNENIKKYDNFRQVQSMLCPTSAKAAKLVNKYISIMFKARENIGWTYFKPYFSTSYERYSISEWIFRWEFS